MVRDVLVRRVTRSDLHERVIFACAMEIALVHSLTIVASERVQKGSRGLENGTS